MKQTWMISVALALLLAVATDASARDEHRRSTPGWSADGNRHGGEGRHAGGSRHARGDRLGGAGRHGDWRGAAHHHRPHGGALHRYYAPSPGPFYYPAGLPYAPPVVYSSPSYVVVPPPVYGGNEFAGMALGAIAGGVIGSQIGDDEDTLPGTVVGAAVGAIIGGAMMRY